MFDDPNLVAKLGQLFSEKTERFDELVAAAGLDPQTDLIGADLQGADFAGSVLDGWDLSRCNLTGASFVGAKVRNLRTDESIGLDLTGSVPLDDYDNLVEPKPADSFQQLVEHIRKSGNGAERGPLIQRLLGEYGSESRTWSFLLGVHVQRERAGRLVSAILNAWEARQPNKERVGAELRFQLLGKNGNPYITVRARLLRELAARLGRNDELLSACESVVVAEGYMTSGSTALSILADVFAGEERVATFLEGLIARKDWSGFKYEVTPALLEGFDSPRARGLIEDSIMDQSLPMYERTRMLDAYYRTKSDDQDISVFLERVFDISPEAELRAAAIRARRGTLQKIGRAGLDKLRAIAVHDKDQEVRVAAIEVIGRSRDQLDILVERGVNDIGHEVRSTAVSMANELGYENRDWYANIFANDPADYVRNAALKWLITVNAFSDDELRRMLIQEMGRTDPGLAAAQSASEALERWPKDQIIQRVAQNLLARLPQDWRGWHIYLRAALAKLSGA